jgi:tetratricopeptide (TPR) repeat protein
VRRAAAAIGLALALAVALAASGPAAAQGRPSAAARKTAREHHEKGKAFQEAGRYGEAIAEYEQAHAAVPDPAFLYNIARCLHLSGERERAIESYQAYLAERPTGEIADEAKSFADELRAELAAEKAAAERAAEARERERARKLAPDRAVAAGPAHGPEVELAPAGDEPAPRRSPARRVAWIASGVGLVAAGAVVDTVPDSGHNGTLEATDFIPVGLYLAGLAALSLGIF